MADPMRVEVVSADAEVWSGEAANVIASTVEGDIGILPGHEPVLALLAPGAVEIICSDGNREVIAVDRGFLSVTQDRVSVLSEYARLGQEISLREAEQEQKDALVALQEGNDDDAIRRRYLRATAQVKAAQTVERH